MELVIRTADELLALESQDRHAARRSARTSPVMRRVLRMFAARGGSIPVEEIGSPPDELCALDADDLIRIQDGHVDVAYPFIAHPSPWVVTLPGGHERYACCATDALGIAPMLGQPTYIRSSCHHCGTALQFPVTPEGPGSEARGVMVWRGKQLDDRCKVVDTW